MSEKYKGTAAKIQSDNPKAVYVHCGSHILNLCTVAACDIQPIRNMMGVLKQIYLFFGNSPKRQQSLELHIGQLNEETIRRKLVDLCKTRWVAHHNAFEAFNDLFETVCTQSAMGVGKDGTVTLLPLLVHCCLQLHALSSSWHFL